MTNLEASKIPNKGGDIKFVCNGALDTYHDNFESYVYNHEKFLSLLQISDKYTYSIINTSTKTKEAQIHFFVIEKEAYSPYQSPFGSFELNETLPLNIFFNFWNFIENDLRLKGVQNITIKNHAPVYSPTNFSKISILLLNNNFDVVTSEMNHHLQISGDSLYPFLKGMRRTRLNRCIKAGFVFHEVEENDFTKVFDFIISCRKNKGYGFSMSSSELLKTAKALPDAIKVFAVKDQDVIIAATVAVIVNKRIMYNFSLAALVEYNFYSPSTMLIDNLYKFCQQNKIEVLDLGTSAINNQPNFKLIYYKESLGGISGIKMTFSKKLA